MPEKSHRVVLLFPKSCCTVNVIGLAVPVEVRTGHSNRSRSHGIAHSWLKSERGDVRAIAE
jgi:hypothetical protein